MPEFREMAMERAPLNGRARQFQISRKELTAGPVETFAGAYDLVHLMTEQFGAPNNVAADFRGHGPLV